MKYEQYITTELWKRKRAERLSIDDNQCQLCCSTEGLQIHHKHYNTLGDEDAKKDLITLCQRCHDVATNTLREKKYKNKEIILVDCEKNYVHTDRTKFVKPIILENHKNTFVHTDRKKMVKKIVLANCV